MAYAYQMTEVERQYCTKKIQTRVDKMRVR